MDGSQRGGERAGVALEGRRGRRRLEPYFESLCLRQNLSCSSSVYPSIYLVLHSLHARWKCCTRLKLHVVYGQMLLASDVIIVPP